jgi:hypothetical protein
LNRLCTFDGPPLTPSRRNLYNFSWPLNKVVGRLFSLANCLSLITNSQSPSPYIL